MSDFLKIISSKVDINFLSGLNNEHYYKDHCNNARSKNLVKASKLKSGNAN